MKALPCEGSIAMTKAAQVWLAGLDPEQRKLAQLPWPSQHERHRWFYTPTDHGGLNLQAMSPAQQSRAFQLLATGLSRAGYVTASTIMGLENVLDRVEGWSVNWGRERGRDPQMYWMQIFGDPNPEGSWSWRFGGHHLSIQHLIIDGQVVSSTPCFMGADPAESPLLGGHLLRPLGAAEDLARDLMRSLDEEQAARALIHPIAPVDIVGANRPRLRDGDTVLPLAETWRGRFSDTASNERIRTMQATAEAEAGVTPEHLAAVAYSTSPKGLPASALTLDQQEHLRAVLGVFIERIPEDLAHREAAKFEGDRLREVHFAWAGGVQRGQPHYYRLQGPRLLAEYDNTQRDVNHIHTVWRDPVGDFGDDILGRHVATAHRD